MEQSAQGTPVQILLVEDNPGDIRLTKEAFEEARLGNELHGVTRGDEALDLLRQQDENIETSRPDIILLDLNLPGMTGLEVLEEIKQDSDLRSIPVIILTSSEAEEDIVKSYEEYANAYLTKPINVDEFIELAKFLGEFWIRMVELPDRD